MTDSSKSALSLLAPQRVQRFRAAHCRLYIGAPVRGAALTPPSLARRCHVRGDGFALCRKLGFGSFRSFQFSLASDLESQRNEGLTDEVSLDNMEQSLKYPRCQGERA
ncbi:MAG: hypothetical protein ACLTYW_01360 [Collinsella sp.]